MRYVRAARLRCGTTLAAHGPGLLTIFNGGGYRVRLPGQTAGAGWGSWLSRSP